MNIYAPRLKAALPYLSLAFALLLCGASFVRSERYRAESDLNHSQTYEVQWRTTQIREHLARTHGQLRLAAAIGRMDADLGRQIFLLNANVDQLLKLEYAPKFLYSRDVELLRGLQSRVGTYLDPIAQGGTDFESALQVMPDLEQRMFEVSGTAVAHAETLNRAAQIAEAASRNRFLFAVALALAAVGYVVIQLRNAFARKQEQHLRSFSSLYAHMTRSRVAALKLFLDYQDEASSKHVEMLFAAREAVEQLEGITNRLGRIAYAYGETRKDRFWDVLEPVIKNSDMKLEIDIKPEAAEALVPALQMRLVLEEVVNNAEVALREQSDGGIHVTGRTSVRGLRRKRVLNVEIADNGPGMTPSALSRAKTPFFSTRAGAHTGLGLTACSQLLAAFKGRLDITSQPGSGTRVEISIPI